MGTTFSTLVWFPRMCYWVSIFSLLASLAKQHCADLKSKVWSMGTFFLATRVSKKEKQQIFVVTQRLFRQMHCK